MVSEIEAWQLSSKLLSRPLGNIFGLGSCRNVGRLNPFNDGLNVCIGVDRVQRNAWMAIAKHSKDLIGERLTDARLSFMETDVPFAPSALAWRSSIQSSSCPNFWG
jgi:hypothetical protein